MPARDRVLEVAREMFAEAGFHGTHFREICKRAGTNVAGICYHLAGENPRHPLIQLAVGLPNRAHLARFLTERSLAVLQREGAELEVCNNCT